MNTRITSRAVTRVCAAVGGTALVLAGGAFPAVAAEDDVQVINTETVQAYTDATGNVQSTRLYEQLALTGDGSVELANPVETSGLRNLNGFSGFDVKDGEQLVDLTVAGEENIRSVSEYNDELPLQIDVEYVLDGEPISPKSLVGKSGDLQVTYTVRNITNRMETIRYTDGKGGTVEEETEVMLPMVGTLATTLPASFRDVEADGANAAGDGKGGTKLSWTMTLLAPLGSDTVELGYSAKVVDAVSPDASVSALPVNPLDNPTLSNAAKSYKGGAETGEKLAAGATTIDENLLKLRDGASDLLAGLIKLRNGADQLSAGLQDEAAPGARKLADGAGELNDGLGQLDDGAGKLADGSGQLADGSGQLADGTGKLADGAGRLNDGAGRLADGTGQAEAGAKKLTGGLKQISDGLDKLAGVDGLQKAAGGIDQLQAGVQTILAGFGAAGQEGTLLDGLTKLAAGLGALEAGQNQIVGGLQALVAPPPASGLPLAKGGVDQVKSGLDGSLAPGGSLDQLEGGLTQVRDVFCALVPDAGPPPTPRQQCVGTLNQLLAGVDDSRTNLTEASGGLGQVSTGLATAIGGIQTQLLPGAIQVRDGLGDAKVGANAALGGAQKLKGGVQQVADGLDQLEIGLTAAIDGVLKLANGANAAYEGSGTLTSGLGELDAGANKLAAGTGELNSGVGQLDSGANKLDAGANKLADGAGQLKGGTAKAEAGSLLIAEGADKLATGLFEAAGGSGLLAQGLGMAAEGAPKLVDGAQRLSDEGTKKLVEAGEDTAQEYGKQYAQIMAGAERANDGKMIVGAPDDAIGLAAYSFEIQGEDGEGSRNFARTLGGLALLGAGAGLFALRRRLV
jgi:putative membrane protein